MVKKLALGLVVALTLSATTGCGGADKPSQTAETSLKTICPKAEKALSDRQGDAGLPLNLLQLNNLRADLRELRSGASLEAKNAIDLFIKSIEQAQQDIADGGPQKTLTSDRDFSAGLSTFADRCKAAGSSALS